MGLREVARASRQGLQCRDYATPIGRVLQGRLISSRGLRSRNKLWKGHALDEDFLEFRIRRQRKMRDLAAK